MEDRRAQAAHCAAAIIAQVDFIVSGPRPNPMSIVALVTVCSTVGLYDRLAKLTVLSGRALQDD